MKADRLPGWAFHRLTVEQKLALSRLRDGAGCGPGPAERAQLKRVLGWKRTHEEAVALVVELLAMGRMRAVIREELGCSERHLRRLLSEIEATGGGMAENRPANPHHSATVSDTTCESVTNVHTAPPTQGFTSYGELDRWLEEHR